jgi:flagellin-like protein
MCGSRLLRLTKNIKALSPVIASIILIAVVVAVSIAATTWMGSISFNFMEVDDLRITGHSWASDTSYIDLTIKNFGTTSITLSDVEVNGVTASDVSFVSGDETLEGGETATLRVTQSFTPSKKYEFAIITYSSTKLVYVVVAPYAGTSEIWYNPSWLKRKAVTIDNALNPNELSGYQLQLNAEYDADMIADFSDLRFTDSDCQTLIPHWVESYVASDSAVVWVNVPTIPASSDTTIYMYYGNPSATSESNPDDTFDVFVDFTRDGVESYGGSQDSNPTQYEIVDDTILRMWGNNWKATMKTLTVAGDGSQAICFDFKSNGTEAEIDGIGLDIDNSISDNWFYRIDGTQTWGRSDHDEYAGTGEWQSFALVLDDFSGDFDRFVFTNDADGGQATNIYYMKVRVSQYTTQAPSTGFDAEETL